MKFPSSHSVRVLFAALAFAAGGTNLLRADPGNAAALVSNAVHEVRLELEAALGKPVPTLGLVLQTPDAEYFASSAATPEQMLATNTTFRFASNTKNFTATAVLLMHQWGWLDVADGIVDPIPGSADPYVPANPNWAIPFKDRVTIEQLLRHGAGVYDVDNDVVPGCGGDSYTAWMSNQDPAHPFTVEEMVAQLSLHNLYFFEPGEGYHYSNTGYAILAEIIARVYSLRAGTPKTFADFLHDHVVQGEPIHFPILAADADLPEPFLPGTIYLPGGGAEVISNYNMSAQIGEGNGHGTLPALNRHVRATLKGEGVLNADTARLMRTNSSPRNTDYAMGCTFSPSYGFGHNGARIGNLAFMGYRPDIDVSMAAVLPLWDYTDGADSWTLCMEAMYKAASRSLAALGYDAPKTLAEGASTNLALAAHQTNTFFFAATHGIYYGVRVSGSSADVLLSLSPGGAPEAAVLFTNGLGWTSTGTGTFRLDVSAAADTPATLRLYTYTNTIAVVSNAIVAAMADEGTVGVSVALVDDQAIAWAQGFGWEDREAGIPVDTNTVFRIGSVSKAFTAALALQYAERGLIDLDAPFTNYTPAVHWQTAYPGMRPVTVQHLLTHHSGLPGDLIRAGFLTKPLGRGYLETIHDLAPAYAVGEPDTINNYCNVGFVLLEGVAEAAAAAEGDSRPFAELANARLFDILGMDGTSYRFDKPAISNHLAAPYMGGQRMPPEYVEIYGTGSLYSRPVDMAQFMKALFSDEPLVLRPETRDLMIADHSTNAPFDAYQWIKTGLGWDTGSDPRLAYAGPAVWKNGATLMYSAQFLFLPEKKLGVAIVASSSSGIPMSTDALALQHALLERDGLPIPTNPVVWPTNLADISQAELDALAGVYVGSANYDLVESFPGSLTYRFNVPEDGLVLQNLRLRSDGWFLSDAAPDHAIAFTNAHERNVVLHRRNHGSFEMPSILAERFAPPPLPASWSNRLGKTWIARNVPADDYMRLLGIAPTLEFLGENGILRVKSGGALADRILDPAFDVFAWIPGIVNRGDSSVQIVPVDGVEHVLYGGYLFGPEPENIPLANSVSGSIGNERFADWHEILHANPSAPVGGVNDIHYQIALSGAPDTFLLRLYEADGVTPLAERIGNGPLNLVSGVSPLLLSVQPGSDGPQTGSYQVDFSVPLCVRAISMGSSNVDLVWQGPAGTPVAVEATAHLAPTNTFAPVAETLASTNLLLRETFPVSPDSARFFRIRKTH